MKEELLLDKAYVIEYVRWSREQDRKRPTPNDMVVVLKFFNDIFVIVETRDKAIFIIPWKHIQTFKFLGKPDWQR